MHNILKWLDHQSGPDAVHYLRTTQMFGIPFWVIPFRFLWHFANGRSFEVSNFCTVKHPKFYCPVRDFWDWVDASTFTHDLNPSREFCRLFWSFCCLFSLSLSFSQCKRTLTLCIETLFAQRENLSPHVPCTGLHFSLYFLLRRWIGGCLFPYKIVSHRLCDYKRCLNSLWRNKVPSFIVNCRSNCF